MKVDKIIHQKKKSQEDNHSESDFTKEGEVEEEIEIKDIKKPSKYVHRDHSKSQILGDKHAKV